MNLANRKHTDVFYFLFSFTNHRFMQKTQKSQIPATTVWLTWRRSCQRWACTLQGFWLSVLRESSLCGHCNEWVGSKPAWSKEQKPGSGLHYVGMEDGSGRSPCVFNARCWGKRWHFSHVFLAGLIYSWGTLCSVCNLFFSFYARAENRQHLFTSVSCDSMEHVAEGIRGCAKSFLRGVELVCVTLACSNGISGLSL